MMDGSEGVPYHSVAEPRTAKPVIEVNMFDWSALMTPRKETLDIGQLAYLFITRTPPTIKILITQGSCYCYSSKLIPSLWYSIYLGHPTGHSEYV
jgi:hypothetical protein